VSELSPEEKRLRLGFAPREGTPHVALREKLARAKIRPPRALAAAAAVNPFPPAFDWRDAPAAGPAGAAGNFITDVKDQQGCGACVAFAVVAAIEALVRIAASNSGKAVDLSEAHLFYVHGRNAGRVCGGGWNPEGALDACRDVGVADEACYPYVAGDQVGTDFLCPDWQARVTRITGWHLMTSGTDMKAWIANRGPLVTGMTIFEDFFDYGGGVYQHVAGGRVDGHNVCVVGYDDNAGYWVCKNSFGGGWGEDGFFRIPYHHCGIDAIMWAAEGIV
jgi:C1A family cysteine protease